MSIMTENRTSDKIHYDYIYMVEKDGNMKVGKTQKYKIRTESISGLT